MGKNHKNAKKQYCQIALLNSKTATESLKPYNVFCFDFQSLRLYKLGYKRMTALLTDTETRLKDPR